MIFVNHPCSNKTLTAPKGMEGEVSNLKVRERHDIMFDKIAFDSFWLPSVKELQALNRGEHIMLTIYGGGHPVVSLGVTP